MGAGIHKRQHSRELTAIGDDDGLAGGAGLGTDGLDGLDDLHTLGDGAEDAVLAIQPLGLDGAQEELGAVGVGTSVGHGEDARASVLQLEVLISELLAIDGLATSAVAASEITTLAHEIVDDTMERGALEMERLARSAGALLAGAEASEILGGLGDDVGAEGHLNATGGLATNGHVEVNNGVRHLE